MKNLADALYVGLLMLGYETFNPNSKSYYYITLLNADHILTINKKSSTYTTTLPKSNKPKHIKKGSLAYIHTLMSNLE